MIIPSLLAYDGVMLGDTLSQLEACGIKRLHIDIMDGHFVPNLSFGPHTVRALRKHSSMHLDCHLMVQDPEKWVDIFFQAGADSVTVHIEVVPKNLIGRPHLNLAIRPRTPIQSLEPYKNSVSEVLLMSVEPGFGGQAFLPATSERIMQLHALQGSFEIVIDGGMTPATMPLCVGAQHFVVGSALFRAPSLHEGLCAFKRS